jgi:diguanylate cyclase (GGDEF)-like protein/PAS domain S-box-containing protein
MRYSPATNLRLIESAAAGSAMSIIADASDFDGSVECATGTREHGDQENALVPAPFVSWVADDTGVVVQQSLPWTECQSRRTLRERWTKAVHPHDKRHLSDAWEAARANRSSMVSTVRFRTLEGGYRWFEARASFDYDAEGKARWFGTLLDIHDRKLTQAALAKSENLHHSIMEASADCIKIMSKAGRLQLMNGPGLCAMEIDDFAPLRGAAWAGLWPPVARPVVEESVRKAQRGEVARFSAEGHTAKGTAKWWDVVVSPIRSADGRVHQLLAISRDVTEQRRTTEYLRRTSETDSLTSLPNRRAFQTRLDAAALRAMERGSSVALLLLDLDHFKQVNDTLGHPAGDHMLTTFATRLRSSVRSTDFVARLGGDEFAVVIEDLAPDQDIPSMLDEMLRRLQSPVTSDAGVVAIEASIGGAVFPADAATANELFKGADAALSSAKLDGRGGLKMFRQHMRQESQRVASQLSLSRTAIATKSIVPYYQPKVSLKTGQPYALEALLRWDHARLGLQHPETVAEGFKNYDTASSFGELMQTAAFRDMASWRKEGIRFGHVALNASPAEFFRDDYAEKLLAQLDHFGLEPSMVEVEVTEHAFLDRAAAYVARAIEKLSKAGIRIALDDFGTGSSSLSHVKDFPVNVLKIDRSFVSSIEGDCESAAIVSAVIGLGTNLSLEVVAEGVETEAQREFLVARGCYIGQGFLFGEAIHGDSVPGLFGSETGTQRNRSSSCQTPSF